MILGHLLLIICFRSTARIAILPRLNLIIMMMSCHYCIISTTDNLATNYRKILSYVYLVQAIQATSIKANITNLTFFVELHVHVY